MRGAPLWLVLAVAVAVAGCGFLTADSGADEATPTVSPVPVPTTETTPEPTTVAPGLAAGRVVDYTTLVEHHASVIRGNSHTYRKRVTRRYSNGTVWREQTTFIQRNQSALRYRYNWSSASGNDTHRSIDRWRSGNRTYVARTDGTRTTVGVGNATTRAGVILGTRGGYASSLDRFLRLLDVTVEAVETPDGQRRYRLSTPEPRQLSPAQNVTFVGSVTPDGVFTEYRLTYRIVRQDIEIDVAVVASFEGIGSTTVARPSWADRIAADTPLPTTADTPPE